MSLTAIEYCCCCCWNDMDGDVDSGGRIAYYAVTFAYASINTCTTFVSAFIMFNV